MANGRRARKWLIIGGVVVLVLIAADTIGLHLLQKPLSEFARTKLMTMLSDRYNADIYLKTLDIRLFPRFVAVGTGLSLKLRDQPGLPPFISADKFVLTGGFLQMLRRAPRFRSLQMTGVHLEIPPLQGHHRAYDKIHPIHLPDFFIGAIHCTDTQLHINPQPADKDQAGLYFWIHDVVMTDFSPDRAAPFHAKLSNPVPIGEIDSKGTWGPWATDNPAETPVKGTYSFEHANMATFPGLAGTLSSTGGYDGVLDRINAWGTTEMPDFAMLIGGYHPVVLNSQYLATIDGTNGNVVLNSVHIQLEKTKLEANGEIAKFPGERDRFIQLNVSSDAAHVEDFLRLAVKSKDPLFTGNAELHMSFYLRIHRDNHVFDRLAITGQFGATNGKFGSPEVQNKVNALSRAGQGEPDATDDGTAISQLNAAFTLKDGIADFSQASFSVKGASVHLVGNYDLVSEQLDFVGDLRLDAKLSQTTTGIKSVLLKMVDPLFDRKHAGADVPIKITGTREKPSYGLDFGRILSRKPAQLPQQPKSSGPAQH
jgi:hypothetical protein